MSPGKGSSRGKRRVIRAIATGVAASIATAANYVDGSAARVIAVIVAGTAAAVAAVIDPWCRRPAARPA